MINKRKILGQLKDWMHWYVLHVGPIFLAQVPSLKDQFPLIQRQWDAVSQFRSQIVHKATMSLREYNTPSFVCIIFVSKYQCFEPELFAYRIRAPPY